MDAIQEPEMAHIFIDKLTLLQFIFSFISNCFSWLRAGSPKSYIISCLIGLYRIILSDPLL